MSKWIAEFELEDGDTMPEHMDLEYKGAKIDFHCRPMWIPCSERLPEEDGLYIVTTSKGTVQFHTFNHNGNSEEYWMRCNKAWMPLPKPYQERGKQE